LTGKLKMPGGWLTGIISLAGVPDGDPQEIVSTSGLLIFISVSIDPQEKASRETKSYENKPTG
jgi:hypothetical protein